MRQQRVSARRVPQNGGPARVQDLVVFKLGGELLEEDADTRRLARAIVRASTRVRLVVVHGGGREIDTALARAGIPKQQVDGLRITDEATLGVVVAVLAGSINTRLVAAINGAGGQAVGLTGADAGVGLVRPARPHRTSRGELVNLGLVGDPLPESDASLLERLVRDGYIPVVACIGASRRGRLFNVNADTLAGSIAARLGAARLVIAGGTPGVMDSARKTIPALGPAAIDLLVADGVATAGMVAKLRACRQALDAGVDDIAIADGRSPRIAALLEGQAPGRGRWTRVG